MFFYVECRVIVECKLAINTGIAEGHISRSEHIIHISFHSFSFTAAEPCFHFIVMTILAAADVYIVLKPAGDNRDANYQCTKQNG